MSFKEGETVTFTWSDHKSSGKNYSRRILKTGEAKFLYTKGDKAFLQFDTPAGVVVRGVSLKRISKRETT